MKFLLVILVFLIFLPTGDPAGLGLSAGKFLVATGYLQDPRFKESVVLLVDYGKEGTLGIVINHPTNAKFSKTFPDWRRVGFDDEIFFGGPVGLEQLFLLVQTRRPPENSKKIFADVYLSSTRESIEAFLESRSQKDRIRLFAGYAGWASGQLEAEIVTGHWKVLDADQQSVFDEVPSRIWRVLIDRLSSIRRV